MGHKNSPSKLKPVIHRTEVQHTPGTSDRPVSIDQYIEEASREMTAERLRKLASSTNELAAKMATEQARPHADLHDHTARLIRLLESEQVKLCKDPLDKVLAEAGVAADYLLKGMDLIPDRVPEIGLTDDARVMSRVFTRNPELMEIT
jgi:uncharacterized membrane protein YkvA (DUF1232 family)